MNKPKLAVFNWNNIVPDLSAHFEMLHPADFLGADAIIVANDANKTQGAIADTARRYGILVFTMQHGRFAASDYLYNKCKPRGDYFLAWGETDVQMAVKGGWSPNRVIRVGAPVLEKMPKPRPDGKTVVFVPGHIEALPSENERSKEAWSKIWAKLRAMDDIEPVIKLLEGEHPIKRILGNKYITDRTKSDNIPKTLKLLQKTSCVVSQVEGTFELLAYAMDIPVILVNGPKICTERQHTAARLIDEDLRELELAVRYAIRNPSKGRERRQYIVEQDAGPVPTEASKNIARVIKEKLAARMIRGGRSEKCSIITYILWNDEKDVIDRIEHPLKYIAKYDNEISVKRIVKGDESDKIAHGLQTDLVVLPVTGKPRMIDMVKRLQDLDKKVVVDCSFNIFNVNPFSPLYARYGQKEVTIDGVKIWSSRKNIDLFSNKNTIENAEILLGLADLVTVASPALIPVYCKYNKNVRYVPTYVDIEAWKGLPMLRDDNVRIGWYGDSGELENIKIVKDAMQNVMDKHKNITFVLLGARFNQTLSKLPQDRIEHHDYVSSEALPYKLATLNLDIMLIPQAENVYAQYMAATKFIESAALELPIVTSFVPPYNGLPTDTAVFIDRNDPDLWRRGIEYLIDDAILRADLSGKARRFAERHHSLKDGWKIMADMYRSLFINELMLVS